MRRSAIFEQQNFMGLEDTPSSPELQWVSVNQLNAWEKCRAKYKLDYVEGLFWPTDQRNFTFGQDVHKLMDYHAKGFNTDSVLYQASPKVVSAYQQLMAAPISHCSVLASEWGFQVPVKGIPQYWLVGRIDRIAQHQNQVLIIDWKTGTAVPKNPENAWQTQLYLYCFYETRHVFGLQALRPEQLQFVYVEVKDVVRLVEIPYSLAQHQYVENRIVTTLQTLQQETAYALPSRCPDNYCPYRFICGIDGVQSS